MNNTELVRIRIVITRRPLVKASSIFIAALNTQTSSYTSSLPDICIRTMWAMYQNSIYIQKRRGWTLLKISTRQSSSWTLELTTQTASQTMLSKSYLWYIKSIQTYQYSYEIPLWATWTVAQNMAHILWKSLPVWSPYLTVHCIHHFIGITSLR